MPPESPNDFFLTEGGHRAYRYIRPTEPPRPLLRPTPPAEPYPVDALGLVLAEAVRAVEAMTQAPLALCAQSVLAAASLATQAHANVLLPTSQHRPVSLALLSLGVSGERKSTVDGLALEAAHDHERALERQYRLAQNRSSANCAGSRQRTAAVCI